jgi:hypothetical protein
LSRIAPQSAFSYFRVVKFRRACSLLNQVDVDCEVHDVAERQPALKLGHEAEAAIDADIAQLQPSACQ